MPMLQTSETVAAGAAQAAASVQQNFAQFSRASERFMKGMVDAAVQQIELSRGLIKGGVEDLSLLAQARTPDTFVQAELEIFRRRSERMIAAAQTFNDELRHTWSEAFEIAESAGRSAAEAAKTPADPAA